MSVYEWIILVAFSVWNTRYRMLSARYRKLSARCRVGLKFDKKEHRYFSLVSDTIWFSIVNDTQDGVIEMGIVWMSLIQPIFSQKYKYSPWSVRRTIRSNTAGPMVSRISYYPWLYLEPADEFRGVLMKVVLRDHLAFASSLRSSKSSKLWWE